MELDRSAFIGSFKSVSEIKEKSGARVGHSRRGRTDKKGVTIAIDRRQSGKSDGYALRLNIGVDLLDQAKIIEGDRVELLFSSEARAGLIRRSNAEGAYKVSFAKKCKTSATVTTTWAFGLPSVAKATPCKGVQVAPEGIIFELPEDASFEHNLREKSKD